MVKVKRKKLIQYAKEEAFDWAYEYGAKSALKRYEDLNDLYELFLNYHINDKTMANDIEMHNQILQLLNNFNKHYQCLFQFLIFYKFSFL